MGVFKEEAHIFEQVQRNQRRIFKDAADIGYPYRSIAPVVPIAEAIQAIIRSQALDKKFPNEKPLVRSRETWGTPGQDGVKVVIRIGWEIDAGQECGTEYTISVNNLGTRYAKSPNFLCHGSDAFMSIDSKPYTEPVKLTKEQYTCPRCHKQIQLADYIGGVCSKCDAQGWWVDPAGGLHHGEDNPAKMYE